MAAPSGKDGPATAEDPYEVSLSTKCLTTCHTKYHVDMIGHHTHRHTLILFETL
jgi:hypothetical protein